MRRSREPRKPLYVVSVLDSVLQEEGRRRTITSESHPSALRWEEERGKEGMKEEEGVGKRGRGWRQCGEEWEGVRGVRHRPLLAAPFPVLFDAPFAVQK